MSARYALLAVLLGLAGFAAVEVAGRAGGVLTAMTPHLWLDAVTFAVATLLLAAAFARPFRRARAWALPLVGLAYLLLYAPLVGLLAAALELTVDGAWGVPALVRSAFVNTPVNVLFTLAMDVGYVALPLGVVATAWLIVAARRSPGR
jgi:hypothetical protein